MSDAFICQCGHTRDVHFKETAAGTPVPPLPARTPVPPTGPYRKKAETSVTYLHTNCNAIWCDCKKYQDRKDRR
jgi:hypothetical protein